jgi:drug/metabolite transporter (DMT)-like permease
VTSAGGDAVAVPNSSQGATAPAVYAAAAAAILLWSGTAIANKIAVAQIDPSSAGLLRSMLAGLVAGGLALTLRHPFPRRAGQRGLLLLSGLSCFAVWPMLMSLGLGKTSASHAALIMAMLPAVTGLIAAAFERAWPRASWWAGVVLAAIGTFALIFYRSGGALVAEEASMTGDLIILAGVVICAFGYVCGGRLSPIIGPWATTFWGLAVATLFNLPALAVLAHRTDWAAVGSAGWLAVAYLTLFSSLVGYIAWFWALGRGGIARIGSWQLAMPVTTLAFAALILGEAITLPLALSGLAILAGTALAQLPKRSARD